MSSLLDIYNSMANFETSKGMHRYLQDYPDMPIVDVKVIPTLSSNILKFKAEVESSQPGKHYLLEIDFFNQVFSKTQTPAFPNKVIHNDNKYVYCPVPTINDQVALKCSCRDFQFRFSHPLANGHALIGEPIQYTPKGTRPSVNPNKTMGLCKHLWTLIKALNENRLINVR